MQKKRQPRDGFDPVLSRGIIAILLVIFALVITLSFFDKAGPLGYLLHEGLLNFLFGQIRYVTPVIILIIAYFLVKDTAYDYRATHGLGALIFFLATSGLFHLNLEPDQMWSETILGHGGGFFGLVAWPLKKYLGALASVISLIGLMLVSFLLMFNTLIMRRLELHKKVWRAFGVAGNSLMAFMQAISVSSRPVANGNEETYEEDYEDNESDGDELEDLPPPRERFFSRRMPLATDENGGNTTADAKQEDDDRAQVEEAEKEKPAPQAWTQTVIIKDLPPLHLLSSKRSKPTSGDIKANKQIIQDTLAEFSINVDMGDIRVGPTVTQYTLKPQKGIKLARITALTNDLSLALAAHPIRIEAPIPGKSLVGIEVPNQKAALVTLKELLESQEFKSRPHTLTIALGKDVSGKAWFGDLPRMPHLLIAGATGSGKTVCINTILMSLLYQNTAETLRLLLVDPKRVELTLYDGIPHLLAPVITTTSKTINALKWTIGEMERRFELLAQAKSRDIHSYNAKRPNDKIPHIIFVIDELADLMVRAAGEVEAGVIRLAQMARAVGIHLILATQRPSVDVITGLMKANIPARIAFSVASLIDSRTILDSSGAEKLLGRGDMLFQTAELSKPVRIQAAFISEDELKNVAYYLKSDTTPTYDESIVDKQTSGGTLNLFGGPSDNQDALFEEAKQAIIAAGRASASFLQRKLKIGYARAARILDELEAAGIIGPANGAKPREILVTTADTHDTMEAGGELNVYADNSSSYDPLDSLQKEKTE